MFISIEILIGFVFIFIFKNLLEMIMYVNYILSLTKLMYYGTLSLFLMKSNLNHITLSEWFALHTLAKKKIINLII
jgi:hypothetical protein